MGHRQRGVGEARAGRVAHRKANTDIPTPRLAIPGFAGAVLEGQQQPLVLGVDQRDGPAHNLEAQQTSRHVLKDSVADGTGGERAWASKPDRGDLKIGRRGEGQRVRACSKRAPGGSCSRGANPPAHAFVRAPSPHANGVQRPCTPGLARAWSQVALLGVHQKHVVGRQGDSLIDGELQVHILPRGGVSGASDRSAEQDTARGQHCARRPGGPWHGVQHPGRGHVALPAEGAVEAQGVELSGTPAVEVALDRHGPVVRGLPVGGVADTADHHGQYVACAGVQGHWEGLAGLHRRSGGACPGREQVDHQRPRRGGLRGGLRE
eukprot:RCo020211